MMTIFFIFVYAIPLIRIHYLKQVFGGFKQGAKLGLQAAVILRISSFVTFWHSFLRKDSGL